MTCPKCKTDVGKVPPKSFVKCRCGHSWRAASEWWRWGDMLASLFASLGIQKKPGCGCTKRQQALNDLGERLGHQEQPAKKAP